MQLPLRHERHEADKDEEVAQEEVLLHADKTCRWRSAKPAPEQSGQSEKGERDVDVIQNNFYG